MVFRSNGRGNTYNVFKALDTYDVPLVPAVSSSFVASRVITVGNIATGYIFKCLLSQNNKSWAWSLYQARLLLRLGRCKSVLVGCHDESTQTFNELLRRMGKRPAPEIQSRVSVLRMM